MESVHLKYHKRTGKPYVFYKGNCYRKRAVKNNKTSWSCSNRECNAYLYTDEGFILKVQRHCLHPPLENVDIKYSDDPVDVVITEKSLTPPKVKVKDLDFQYSETKKYTKKFKTTKTDTSMNRATLSTKKSFKPSEKKKAHNISDKVEYKSARVTAQLKNRRVEQQIVNDKVRKYQVKTKRTENYVGLLPLGQMASYLFQLTNAVENKKKLYNSTVTGEDVGDYPGPSSSGGGSLGLEDSTSSPDHFLSEALADPKQASPLHQLPSSSSSSNAQRPESYKLCHNNHLSLVLEALAADESFMDVTLTAQGKSLKAHKSVLSAVSPYFRGVLKENPCQHPIIIMPRDVKYEELNNIISYIYRGEMTVATEDLSSLLKTAEILQVTGLSPSESMGGLDTIVNQNLADRINSPTRSSATPKSSNKKSTETPRNTTLSASSNLHSAESTPRSLFSDGIVPTDFMDVNLTCVKEELQSFDEDDDQDNLSRMKISNVTNQMSDTETEPPQKKRRTTTSKSQNAAPNDTTPEDPLPKQCPYCTEIPTDLETINEHLKDKHASEKVFVCSNCLRIYVNNDLYADHLKKCEDTSVL